nr:DUF4760 domain-containing protein [uncultured Desulfuromonas sp.]
MVLKDFSAEIIPIVQTIIAFVGLISLFLLWWQIRQNNIWNKLRSEHNFIQKWHLEFEVNMIKAAQTIGIDLKFRPGPLSDDEISKIVSSEDVLASVTMLLCDIENICAAIRIGAADNDLAYATHSSRIVARYKMFEPLIEYMRTRENDDEIYIEFQKIALEWEARHLSEVEKQKASVATLSDNLLKAKGVCKKV